MSRFIKSCIFIIMLMRIVPALAGNVSEQRDIVSKKVAFLRNQKDYIKQKAALEREGWERFSEAVDEYLRMYDEMTEADEAAKLSEEQLSKLLQQIKHLNDLIPMQLPSGQGANRRFGAYYTKLKYYPEWDKPWRVGPDADVVVQFDDGGHRFVFWRGTNYIPHWVTDNGIWYNNEFTETWPTRGCSEPMSDKQCRYSNVRIIENHPGRVVVHWRYALCDVDYRIAWPDSETGWGDWADEYYYIYPDAIGTRKIILHTSRTADFETHHRKADLGHEWHEGIMVYNAFVMPEEVLHVDAVHVANMKGESERWSWQKPGRPTTPTPDGSNIVLMNVRSQRNPFVISPQGCYLDAYKGCQSGSRFRWRDHWPTTMEDVTGRNASGRKASHGSFFNIGDTPVYERDGVSITKVLLHGMSGEGKGIDSLLPVAKSWLKAPKLAVESAGVRDLGYDQSQRAYVLSCDKAHTTKSLEFKLKASEESPVVNPAFIIKNRGEGSIKVAIDGKEKKAGIDFQYGYNRNLEGTDLVIWLKEESVKPVCITFIPSY